MTPLLIIVQLSLNWQRYFG